MRCVAAAIFNEFGEPVGGVSVSGPDGARHAGARRRISVRWCAMPRPRSPGMIGGQPADRR